MTGISLVLAGAVAVTPAPQPQEHGRRLPETEAVTVLVDVVVRDDDGRPVTDLGAPDFEVREDGVEQRVERFEPPPTLAREKRADPTPPTGGRSSPESDRGAARAHPPATIAFVFDRLSTEGRVAAQRAARDYLEEREPGDVAGVFSVEDTLVVLQDFTSDPSRVEAALDAVGTRVAQAGPTTLDTARARAAEHLAADTARAVLLETPSPTSNEDAVAHARAYQTAARLSMARAIADAFEHLARDAQGYATANALTAIVDALRALPGRKAVVLFSEGLFRTEASEERFLCVVNSANRAQVAVYAVEAAGLQVNSYEAVTRDEIVSAAALSQARQATGTDAGGGAFTRDLEASGDLVRFHPRASLEWIADATGGVFVRDTNDLEGALRTIDTDLRTYYLLGYTPRNELFDGRFRKIEVKVARRGVHVRARSGYFAVRSSGPVLAHVAPVLALLESGQRPHAIPVFAGAWAFPQEGGPTRVPVVVSVPASAVRELSRSRPRERLDVTLLARLLDEAGHPVEAMSRRFLFEPKSERPSPDLWFVRDAWLAPGRYTLEAAAWAAGSGRAGALTERVEVDDAREPLDRVQALVVRSALAADAAPAELEADHPLRYGGVVLEPLAGEPISAAPPRPLIFQATVPSSAGALPPAATVSVWKGERRLAATRIEWGPPEAGGLRRHVGEVPTGPLPPGRYELRVELKDGTRRRVITRPFAVAD